MAIQNLEMVTQEELAKLLRVAICAQALFDGAARLGLFVGAGRKMDLSDSEHEGPTVKALKAALADLGIKQVEN